MQRLHVDRADVVRHAHCERCGRAYADESRAEQKGWTMTVIAGSIEGFRCPRHGDSGDAGPELAPAPAASGQRPAARLPADCTPGQLMDPVTYRAACERASQIGGIGPAAAGAADERWRVFVSAYANPDGHHLGAVFALERLPTEALGDGTPVLGARALLAGGEAAHLEAIGPHLATTLTVAIRGDGFGAAVRARTREHVARVAGLALPE